MYRPSAFAVDRVDYQHDMVAVIRWIDGKQKPKFVRLLETSIKLLESYGIQLRYAM